MQHYRRGRKKRACGWQNVADDVQILRKTDEDTILPMHCFPKRLCAESFSRLSNLIATTTRQYLCCSPPLPHRAHNHLTTPSPFPPSLPPPTLSFKSLPTPFLSSPCVFPTFLNQLLNFPPPYSSPPSAPPKPETWRWDLRLCKKCHQH